MHWERAVEKKCVWRTKMIYTCFSFLWWALSSHPSTFLCWLELWVSLPLSLSLSLSQHLVTPLQTALITAHNKTTKNNHLFYLICLLIITFSFFVCVLFTLSRAHRCQRKCRGWIYQCLGVERKCGREMRREWLYEPLSHSFFHVTISWTGTAEHFSS